MIPSNGTCIRLSGLIILIITALLGCGNTIDPLDETRGNFVIHGALNLHEQFNFIRVRNLHSPLNKEATLELNATVHLQNLTTGEKEILDDSLVFFDEFYTHNFKTTIDINPEMTYQLSVHGDNGSTKSVSTVTPPYANHYVGPAFDRRNCETTLFFGIGPVSNRGLFEVEVGFSYGSKTFWNRPEPNPYSQFSSQWVTVQFKPVDFINETLNTGDGAGTVWCHELSDDQLYVRYTVYSEDFEDGVGSGNRAIPGGIGRFGSYYNETFSFEIDTTNICYPFC